MFRPDPVPTIFWKLDPYPTSFQTPFLDSQLKQFNYFLFQVLLLSYFVTAREACLVEAIYLQVVIWAGHRHPPIPILAIPPTETKQVRRRIGRHILKKRALILEYVTFVKCRQIRNFFEEAWFISLLKGKYFSHPYFNFWIYKFNLNCLLGFPREWLEEPGNMPSDILVQHGDNSR